MNLNPGSLFSDSRIKSAFNGLCIQPWWLGGRAVAAHSVVSTVSIMVGSNLRVLTLGNYIGPKKIEKSSLSDK